MSKVINMVNLGRNLKAKRAFSLIELINDCNGKSHCRNVDIVEQSCQYYHSFYNLQPTDSSLLIHANVLLAILAAAQHWFQLFSLLSTRTSKSFSASNFFSLPIE